MIRLNEETAIQIEKAAIESLEKYAKDWYSLTKEMVREIKTKKLELLHNFDGLDLQEILESDAAEDFMKICVELSICQNLLNGQSTYR